MKEMLTKINYYCPSHNYPFEITIFLAKAWDQQLDLVPLIHLCNVISLTTNKQKKFVEGVQIRFSTLKLKPFPKFKKNTTMTQL
jgi:hypothetical protein